MKQLALRTAAVLAALASAAIAWQFREVLVLFVVSLAVAAALRPAVDRLARRGLPRAAALLAAYLLTLGVRLLVLWSAAGPVLDDLGALVDDLSLAYEHAWAVWPVGSAFQRAAANWMPPIAALYDSLGGTAGTAALQAFMGVTANVADVLASIAIALVLSVYWSADQPRAERLLLSALAPANRARARDLWRSIEAGVGAYLRSELVQSALAGVVLGLAFAAIGLNYPALLGMAAALLWLVPWLGAGLTLGLVVLTAWVQTPWLALLAGVSTAGVFAVLEYYIEPRLSDRRQRSSLLVVLIMIVMGKAFGLAGVLASPPLAAAIQITLSHLLAPTPAAASDTASDDPAALNTLASLGALDAQLSALRAGMPAGNSGQGAPESEALNLADRLQALVKQASETVSAESQPA